MIPEHPAPGNEAQRAHPSTLPHVGPRGAAMQGQGVQGGGGGVEELEAHLSKLKLATSVHQISMEPHRCAAYALSYVICPIVKSRVSGWCSSLSYGQVSGWCSSHACSSDGKGIILSSSFGVVGRKSLCQRSSSRYVCLSVSVGARGLCKLTRTILSSHARRPDMHADRTSWATSCDMQTRSMLRHAVTCQHTRTEML